MAREEDVALFPLQDPGEGWGENVKDDMDTAKIVINLVLESRIGLNLVPRMEKIFLRHPWKGDTAKPPWLEALNWILSLGTSAVLLHMIYFNHFISPGPEKKLFHSHLLWVKSPSVQLIPTCSCPVCPRATNFYLQHLFPIASSSTQRWENPVLGS